MAEIDIEKVERLLWIEGYDYQFSALNEDGDAFLEVYGIGTHVVVDGLYPEGEDGWGFYPETMYVHREAGPVWRPEDGIRVDVDDIYDEEGLCEAITDVLGALEV